ncbi:uncharacterized protein LOC124225762 isoform X3 [Equus quagga]|uniref:uncharacterized protein LOC124225762 isoform X3 n=1 Tax=Equus quagga TaxID=89248 RepID=UPI001EE299E2|nr:uncharacterized protein LOC124225762 isoform X3 [Equus quagga]
MLRPVGECRAEREADESEVPVPDVEQMLQAALDFLLTDLTTPGLAVRLRPLAPFRAHRKPKNFLLCVQFSVTSLFTLLCCDHHRHPSPELFSFSQTETLFSPNNGSPFPFLQPLATPFLLSDSESDYSRCPILETHNGNGLVLLCQHQYRRSHKFLTNPTMSEPHGALETSQKFWGSVAGWFWLRIPHVAVVRRHLGCTHLKARLGLEHLPSRQPEEARGHL